jgi:serine/threonine protein kinase
MNSDDLDFAQKMDEVCTRFEAGWKAGARPRIDDCLAGLAGEEQLEVLRELIVLDVHYRLRLGETCVPADYQAFPEVDTAWLENLLRGGAETRDPDPGESVCGRVDYLGAYEVLEEISAGGMGRILRVRDEGFGRTLAMKVPRRQDATADRRFVREVRITGRLQHPGIPPVHAWGRLDDGRPYFVMKLIEGNSLSELLNQRVPR